MKLYVDDEPFRMDRMLVRRRERTLDVRRGLLRREVEWETPDGRSMVLRTQRFVSLEHRHVVVLDYEVEMIDGVRDTHHLLRAGGTETATGDQNEELDPRRAIPAEGALVTA